MKEETKKYWIIMSILPVSILIIGMLGIFNKMLSISNMLNYIIVAGMCWFFALESYLIQLWKNKKEAKAFAKLGVI